MKESRPVTQAITEKESFSFSIFEELESSVRVLRGTVFIKAENYEKAVELLRKLGYLDGGNFYYTSEVPLF